LKKKQDEEKKLSEMMIPKKSKRLYDKIMHSKKKQRQEVEKLKEKRQKFEQSKADKRATETARSK
jgi:pescadillo protein